MVSSPKGLGPEKDCAGKGQQHIQKTDPTSLGLGPEKDCAGKGQQHIQKTDPTSRQRGRPTRTRP
jgi:hypothetical protein